MLAWTTSTYRTMAYDRGKNPNLLQVDLPRSALKYEYLLDAIFAYTALHLAYQNQADPHTCECYVSAATSFRDRGLQRVAPAMQEFQLIDSKPEESEMFAMFWFSAFAGLFTMSLAVVNDRQRSLSHAPSDHTGKPFTNMLVEIAQLWRGTQAIVDVASALRAKVYISGHDEQQAREEMKLEQPELEPEIDSRLSQLATLIDKPGPSTGVVGEDPYASLYRRGVSELRAAFESLAATGTFDQTMAWAPVLGNDFALLLEEGAPRVLLSTMVYGTLLAQTSYKWWAEGVGKALVDECSLALADSPEEWHDLIRWARARVDLPVAVVQHDTPGVSHAG
jgi:hypothetical protein